jgi:3-methylfumaryl-CoA hydratase
MTTIDITYLQGWVGKQETLEDDITLFPAKALAAALDNEWKPKKGDALPPFWEWLYFLATPKASATGLDGHPEKGGFLPPVPLPRRMWAAGEAEYHQPLIIGEPATRLSTIQSVELKEGSTGALIFVVVKHEIFQHDHRCITETQNLVYREQPDANAPPPPIKQPPEGAEFSQVIRPNPVLLYRFSALTYNGHRIHYDRTYAMEEELYPALVVHGPLLVTLLLELKRAELPDTLIRKIKFRAVRPTFDTHDFVVEGKRDNNTLSLWSKDHEGALCMLLDAVISDKN